ncbi:MAG: PIG-L family deacetylase [Tepidiformaceae bacterium]
MPMLLALIAHPDDESYSFGGTLALAARAGWRCQVICLTSGEAGKRHDGGPISRAAVGLARERELARSCALLGAASPEFWRLPDGHLREHPPQVNRLRAEIETRRPDMLLSLGTDGAYGHPDHIAAYACLLEAWRVLPAPRPPLLLAAFPLALFLPQYEKCRSMMGEPPRPAPAEIGSGPWHYELPIRAVAALKLAAVACHRSQLPGGDPEAIFPPGIIPRLLQTERFADARGSEDSGTTALLAGLTAPLP